MLITYTSTKPPPTLWIIFDQYCTKAMQDCIEEHPDFEMMIVKNPDAKLLHHSTGSKHVVVVS